MQESARRVQEASSSVGGEAAQLEAAIGAARTKRRQLEVLAGVADGALLIGQLLSPFLARLLPFALDEHAAALVLHQIRGDAGVQIMAVAKSRSYRELRDTADLLRANEAVLSQYRATDNVSKESQRCVITVSVAE